MQKKIVTVRNLRIGEGCPKICVPMVGTTAAELCDEAAAIVEAGAQMAEWRLDWFENWREEAAVAEALWALRRSLGELPLLVTFRTREEGGNADITPQQYGRLYETVLAGKQADLIDLELFFHEETVNRLLAMAGSRGVKTVLSNHEFGETPEAETICQRLRRMEEKGCDIAKIAVMPQSSRDVAELLKATAESSAAVACPIVTMSMGGRGVISRMAGQIFGSAITFGTVGKASAPGQLPLEQLKEILKWIDDAQ